MQAFTQSQFQNLLTIAAGKPRACEISLYAIIKNEMFFLPAFFAHYRALGVEQFLILDDRSSDASRQFLENQPDCVVLTAPHGFGDKVSVDYGQGAKIGRAGTHWKRAIPQRFLQDRISLYVDADEFMLLPQSIANLKNLFSILRAENYNGICATLVDFYPANLTLMHQPLAPTKPADLFACYNYFDATAFMHFTPGHEPKKIAPTASDRLYESYGIRAYESALLPKFFIPKARSPWRKTPIIHWNGQTWLDGSHLTNRPITAQGHIAIAHFKFTYDLTRRIALAKKTQAYAKKSEKYDQLAALLNAMEKRDGSFLSARSHPFTSPRDLQNCGLITLESMMAAK